MLLEETEMRRRLILFLLACLQAAALCRASDTASRPFLAAAEKVAIWLESVSQTTQAGKAWPADPAQPDASVDHLYHGNAGVVLFYLQLHRVTRNKHYLAEAIAGGRHLLAKLPETLERDDQAGLYTGVCGVGFVLEELHRASGDRRFREGADRCLEMALARTSQRGDRVQLGEINDIMAGKAGVGLFLLYAAKTMNRPRLIEIAAGLGRTLMDKALKGKDGWQWRMSDSYERIMPNFSHGGAGVSFFLIQLYDAVKDPSFLEGALAGGRYLRSTANGDGLVHHHHRGGETLYYLGWCHGPAGSSRLYRQLWKTTGDRAWRELLARGLDSVLASGVPERQTPGYWNNVGQCCGAAGIAECAMRFGAELDDPRYSKFAKHIADYLLELAEPENGGLKWTHAEHRVQPDLLAAQTGYMQGAAGIGSWFLKLDAHGRGEALPIRLPDTPI